LAEPQVHAPLFHVFPQRLRVLRVAFRWGFGGGQT
jgi:hypothetical protein